MNNGPFTDTEVRIARFVLRAPDDFHLTEPERRACAAVISHAVSGEPVTDDDARIAKALFRAILEEVTTQISE